MRDLFFAFYVLVSDRDASITNYCGTNVQLPIFSLYSWRGFCLETYLEIYGSTKGFFSLFFPFPFFVWEASYENILTEIIYKIGKRSWQRDAWLQG